jgi:TetR/AcrR family transcriptional repressor of mexJK operon
MSTGISSPESKSMGRPKDLAKAQAILDAAQQLFMEHGYELTSMDAVAKIAGVSKLTIYSHFENKELLFRRVIERKCEESNMPTNMLQLAALPPREGLRIIGINFVGLIYSQDAVNMFRILESESLRHPKIAHIFYEAGPERTISAVEELLKAWDAKGALVVPQPRQAVNQFYSLLKGEMHMKLMLNLASHPSTAWIEKHVDACVEMFLCAYEKPRRGQKKP